MNDPFLEINRRHGYKYTDFREIFAGSYLHTAIVLWNSGILEKDEQGRYPGQMLVAKVQEYHGRLGTARQLAESLDRDVNEIRTALARSGLQGEYFVNIATGQRSPKYALASGKDAQELAHRLKAYFQDEETARTERGQRQDTISYLEIEQATGLSRARVERALQGGLREKYFGKRSGQGFRLKEGMARKDLLEEIQGIDGLVLLRELPRLLRIPPSRFHSSLTPAIRNEYLEPLYGKGRSTFYHFREGKTADDLAAALRASEQALEQARKSTQTVKEIDWLMFLQGRYPQDLEYAAKIELFLIAYADIPEERRWSMEHQMLDGMVGLVSEHMSSSRVDAIGDQLQQEYEVSLRGLCQEGGSLLGKVFDEADGYGLLLPEGELTLPRLSGRLGKSVLSLKRVIGSQRGLWEKHLKPCGGTRRVPHYKLRPETTLEEMVRDVLVKTELEDKRAVIGPAQEYAHSAHRVMFPKNGRYHLDKSYRAKIAFYELAYPHVLLRHGWQGTQLLEHRILDGMLQILLGYLHPTAAEHMLQGVEHDYGISLRHLIEGHIGTRRDDPFEQYQAVPSRPTPSLTTSALPDSSSAAASSSRRSSRKGKPRVSRQRKETGAEAVGRKK